MEEKKLRPTRFAHLEGFTDLVYSDDGRYIITSGEDGEVRIFEGLDDDDCKTHIISDCIHAISYKKDNILVGTDQNMVMAYTFNEGKPNGIICRFISFPTHIDYCKRKDLIAMGSSDMTLKVHDAENYKEIHFTGHTAPILSVALDSQGKYVASASCDGTVRVWDLRSESEIKSFNILQKSNDFSFAESVCRLKWSKDDYYLIVPVNTELLVYERRSWTQQYFLKDDKVDKPLTVVAVSPCGNYVGCGSKGGHISVFELATKKCIASVKETKGLAITGLQWNPTGKQELAFVNNGGNLGTYSNFLNTEEVATDIPSNEEYISHEPEPIHIQSTEDNTFDVMDEDDSEFSLAKIKSQMGFADDEEGTYIGRPTDVKEDDAEDNISVARAATPTVVPNLPEPQHPFQPGMSPEHLTDRYMVWNNTGIVKQYNNDDESSIEVEFHDSAVHHPLHLNNFFNFSKAALNNNALVLAAEAHDDQNSKLSVQHFGAWDMSKEWQIDMPEEEDIVALTLGNNWICAATNERNLRLFSTAGVQRDIIACPGAIVCLSGFEDYLMVIYHSGIGAGGEQCMSMKTMNVNTSRELSNSTTMVPLSPKSYLAWAGFTDEGSPFIVDSEGVIKLYVKKYGTAWIPIMNTKNNTKGKSDNYFILGGSEVQGNIRCILCKGSRYPPILPRPHVSLLEIMIPVCEPGSDKSTLEANMMKNSMLISTLSHLNNQDFDIDQLRAETEKSLMEVMIKMFALACRSDRESRGFDLCQLMTSCKNVELALKYAAKLNRPQLIERLSELANTKRVAESERYTAESTSQGYHRSFNFIRGQETIQSPDIFQDTEECTETAIINSQNNLLYEAAIKKQMKVTEEIPLIPSILNPFRKRATKEVNSKGLDILDAFKPAKRKGEENPVLRPVLKKPRVSKSTDIKGEISSTQKENIFDRSKENCQSKIKEKLHKKVSALQLWLEDNLEEIKAKYPDASETSYLVKAALLFRDVEITVKQKYKQLAAESNEKDESIVTT